MLLEIIVYHNTWIKIHFLRGRMKPKKTRGFDIQHRVSMLPLSFVSWVKPASSLISMTFSFLTYKIWIMILHKFVGIQSYMVECVLGRPWVTTQTGPMDILDLTPTGLGWFFFFFQIHNISFQSKIYNFLGKSEVQATSGLHSPI